MHRNILAYRWQSCWSSAILPPSVCQRFFFLKNPIETFEGLSKVHFQTSSNIGLWQLFVKAALRIEIWDTSKVSPRYHQNFLHFHTFYTFTLFILSHFLHFHTFYTFTLFILSHFLHFHTCEPLQWKMSVKVADCVLMHIRHNVSVKVFTSAVPRRRKTQVFKNTPDLVIFGT